MTLRGIDFGWVMNASGARGFFGETGSFYLEASPKPNWKSATFVAKTTTITQHQGNLEFNANSLKPKQKRPDCIWINKEKEVVLNSVGLSGPGLPWLLQQNKWQRFSRPFFLSFMPVQRHAESRRKEVASFVDRIQSELENFSAPVGLQINLSCPNTEVDTHEHVEEVVIWLDMLQTLNIPIVCKLGVQTPLNVARKIASHSTCDALYISNTIPWGDSKINWEQINQNGVSPLQKLGGGGLSGTPLKQHVADWLDRAKKSGIEKPIIAGGGILTLDDAKLFINHGAAAISLGVIALLYPERVSSIVKRFT